MTKLALHSCLAAFIFLVNVQPVAALDISLSSALVLPGNNVQLSINFSNAPAEPISAFALYLTSTNAFTTPTVAAGSGQPNLVCFVDSFSNGVWRVTGFVLAAPAISNGLVATLTFNVPMETLPGLYPISFTGAAPPDAPPGSNPETRALVSSSLLPGTAQGGVIQVLVPGEAATITSITPQAGNIFLLQFSGTAGALYSIEATTNLLSSPSQTEWMFLTNVLVEGSGLFQFIELDSSNYPARFFRAVTP